MICLKSPKSSEFAFLLTNRGQKSVTMFISLRFNNYSIKFFFKKLRPQWDLNSPPLGFEAMNTCAIGRAKKTAGNVFK